MPNTIFTNVQVFDGKSTKLYPAEVEVQGNRIHKIARNGKKLPRDGKTVVDGGGATLMPGLINTHAHISYPPVTTLKEIVETPIEENTLIAAYHAELMLDHGFTAIISGASAKPRLDIVIRNAINAGRLTGPRMLATSPELTVVGGLSDDTAFGDGKSVVGMVGDCPDDFRRMIRILTREGVDMIKFNNSGDSFCYPHMPADTNPMTEDEVRTICETAKNLGRRIIAHAHADSSVRQCIEYGVEFIYHATFVSDRTIERLAKVKDKHYVSPAFGLRYNTLYEASDWGLTQEVSEITGNKAEFEACIENMSKMHKAGIKVLPFGDYGFAWIPIGTDTRDFEHFVNYFGFAPHEILRAATAYGGEAFGTDKMGQVKAGYLADLIMIDGDPLKDLTLFQDRRSILMIMKDGQYHKEPRLPQASRQVGAA